MAHYFPLETTESNIGRRGGTQLQTSSTNTPRERTMFVANVTKVDKGKVNATDVSIAGFNNNNILVSNI